MCGEKCVLDQRISEYPFNEHRPEVEEVSKSVVTRSNRKECLSTIHKSAGTDHILEKNHIICQ